MSQAKPRLNVKKLTQLTFSLFSFQVLMACGGGGGDSSSNNTITPSPTTSEPQLLVQDSTFERARSVELVLYAPQFDLSDISWQQTSGESLEIISPNSKLITVTPTTSGDYAFSVQFTQNGQVQTLEQSFSISEQSSALNVPSGQAVLTENKISLRAFASAGNDIANISWTQLSGDNANITSDNYQGNALIFDAPRVSQDSLLQFQVNATVDGQNVSDTVSVLIEYAPTIAENAYFDDRVAKVFPYKADSPYSGSLVNCVYSNTLSSSCRLNQLPLLAHDTMSPTIDDIMDRVVVSHPWMGERFEEFLRNHDEFDDFKRLLRATTAVVIAYDVRPAFYWAATGAIYLDPSYLWLTPNERDTINEAPDYRSSFGVDLQFSIPWRYVKDNGYAFPYYDPADRQTRRLDELIYPLGYLLYHELAHANDFFPAQYWQQLSMSDRILDAAFEQAPISESLTALYPLDSQTMADLAQVRYGGSDASASQEATLPSDVSQLFEPDSAVHFYSYFTEREDFAMLFEELMMQHRYNVYRDVAVTNNPSHKDDTSGDYIVDWGQRGRLAEPQLNQRLNFVVENVLPEFDAASAISELPAAIEFTSGLSWRDNLVLGSANGSVIGAKSSLAGQLLKAEMEKQRPPTEYHYYSKPLPKR